MKKKCNVVSILKMATDGIILKMKLLTLLIFAAFVSASASSYSQSVKFNFHLTDITIIDVFHKIEEQSKFVILFNEKTLDVKRKVDVVVTDETVDKILDQIFDGDKDAYKIFDHQIAISPIEIKDLPSIIKSETNAEQQKKVLSGSVKDSKGVALPGVSIVVKGTTIGTVTDMDGQFRLMVPIDAKTVVFSFIGMVTQEIAIDSKTAINIILQEQTVGLEEVVAVGYGVQKKASVVGAITTTTSKELQRTGGVANLGMALTGQLPGVTTIQISGMPGSEDPKIYIRGQGTWNGGQPYILVDGIERKMNDIDVSEVDNISVLKDASATAVYGVKGANGVILITTKRGSVSKPALTISVNSSLKAPSRLIKKLDSYDMFMVKNEAIEREVPLLESMWADYTPLSVVQRYRNQENLKWPEAYPNVDWEKESIKPYAMNHRVNLNVSGGTNFARYFSSLAYTNEGDLMKVWDNGRGYKPGYTYDRFNFRTNLDLNLTKTTSLKINLSGVYGIQKTNRVGFNTNGAMMDFRTLSGYYALPPNAYLPRYADGRWGQSPNQDSGMINSVATLANSGNDEIRRTDLISDFGVTQKLDFITKGLSANANLSFDNHFESIKSIVEGSSWTSKYISPAIEDMPAGGDPNSYITLNPVAGTNQFPWVYGPWYIADENADGSLSTLRRRLYYQAQINYSRIFGKHDVTATGVFTREQLATGSEFQRYREDWVFRATYNYDNRYFAEFNGAYNGSEKFGPEYRFAFFPSGAVGWTISNEQFMKGMESWLDKLRVRYSYGIIGDDGGLSDRWLYNSQYIYSGAQHLTEYALNTNISPYTIYRESLVGNPDVRWEQATKTNLGFEIAVLKNMLSGNFEFFTENRTDILLLGSSRIIPAYFGKEAPTANVGEVTKKGYEMELRFNKNVNNWHLWANTSMTHAVDKIIYKEEPELKDPHLLAAGFQIDQVRSIITTGFMNTWDQVYAGAPMVSNNPQQLPGNYFMLDFDSDGVIDGAKDPAPYGYSNRPQNSYNLSMGADYKGFSAMIQFYGVNNVTRYINLGNFGNNLDLAYAYTLDHWSKENPDATSFLPRWKTGGGQNIGQYLQYDGSFLRLKTAEVAYTFTGEGLKRAGMSSLKLYLNGNNLFFWSKLPDDREQQLYGIGDQDRYGAYPTSRRINLGVDIKF